jgi:hypothetical protein
MRAVEDLPTEDLLAALRIAPVSSYRRKEVDEALALDLAEHKDTFSPPEKPKRERETVDPARLLAAMAYSAAPQGESGGETPRGAKPRPTTPAPEQGDPLGPMRVERPKLDEGGHRVYSALKVGESGEPSVDNGGQT